jgi:hypothetical protein
MGLAARVDKLRSCITLSTSLGRLLTDSLLDFHQKQHINRIKKLGRFLISVPSWLLLS